MNRQLAGNTAASGLFVDYRIVSSSSIAAVGYDARAAILAIRFHNGAEYHYSRVPVELFTGLLNAPSVGTYYHQKVRNAGFSYQRMR